MTTDAVTLLAEAIGIDPARAHVHSREPLGAGSITGVTMDDDGATLHYFVDTSRLPVPAETGMALGAGQRPQARIWLHPADPHLPTLASTAFGGGAGVILARAGVDAAGTVDLVGYRPGRRAVLRVDADPAPVWLKVVRPSRVDRIVQTHRTFEEAGLPVPPVLAWAPQGLVVLASAAGTPATHAQWDAETLLDEVDALRGRIAGLALSDPVRGVVTRLDWYADLLTDRIGRDRMAGIVDRIRAALAADPAQATCGVHGDLHYGQLFLHDGAVTGLIDLDTAGEGDPAEDAAAFLAHAIASSGLTETREGRERVEGLVAAATKRWVGPRVAALTGIHLIGHALAEADRDDRSRTDDLLARARELLERADAA